MVQPQYDVVGAGRALRLDDHRVESSFVSAIDAVHIPAAIIDRSGRVHAVNAAWAQMPEEFENTAACRQNANILDWCRGLADQIAGTALRNGIRRVLAGAQRSHEQSLRNTAPDAGRWVRFCIDRIGETEPRLFLGSLELMYDVEARVQSAQIEERQRIAAELHDSVGQCLLCVDIGLTRLSGVPSRDPEFASIVADMAESLRQAHAQIRTMSFLLYPPWQEQTGAFVKSAQDLVTGFARRAGLHVRLEVVGFPCALGDARELALFRILQEALVNIHRHAHARSIGVKLLHRGRSVVLNVRDDGVGMAPDYADAPNAGVGLMSMRSRMQRWGGDLRIVTGKDGTILTARLQL